MKRKHLLATILFSFIQVIVWGQQSNFRSYKSWDKMAFCSYSTYHPFEYSQSDNNWELLLTLRTPLTAKQLDSLQIKYTDSQLMFLNIGGLIENKDDKWHTTIPIFEESQTVAIRKQSREIAETLYAETKQDWKTFLKILAKRNQGDHAFSFAFSYSPDGKIWKNGLLPGYKDLSVNPTWDGACWFMYDKRPNSSCGTNTYYGIFCQTWTDELSYWLGPKTIAKFINEYKENGKIEDKEFIKAAAQWGLTDESGNITIPIIDESSNDDLVQIRDVIIQKLAKGIKQYAASFSSEYQLGNEKMAQVILYHEVMWDMLDILIEKKTLAKPKILMGDSNVKSSDFKHIVYILK